MSGNVESLRHVTRQLSNGGIVLVLDTGAIIGPEATAMLQALHSRSVGGIREHLKTLAEKGAQKFMESFYVGYGHKSIGDCGTASIFIEGVSMIVAKAIQDWELYNGQESSTRYIDFAQQPFLNPEGSVFGNEILEKWREFYVASQKPLQEHLKRLHPRQDGEKEAVYEKAIAARAFDILRGFLPAGATTNLSWHTTLRQAADKLMLLRHHPLAEVREVTAALEDALREAYPSSFGHKRYDVTEDYNKMWMENYYYFPNPHDAYFVDGMPAEFEVFKDDMDYSYFMRYGNTLSMRPPKTELPKFLKEGGVMGFGYLLDFGSYRDIQRQRSVTQRMPLLTTDFGFEGWYLEQLPEGVRHKAEDLISDQEGRLAQMYEQNYYLDRWKLQYYVAMGYRTVNRLVGSLPSLVYIVELRATRFVHPTLRRRARQMAEVLQERFRRTGLALHLDREPDRFDVKRGEHDIVMKN